MRATLLGNSLNEFGRIVRLHQERLTRGQRRVVDYMTRHFDDCAFLTSNQIGTQAGVSETTVIRLAGSLEFSGFADMQNFIRAGLVQSRIDRVGQTQPEMKSERAILAQVAQLDSENIQETLTRNSGADLVRAADMILAAPAICTVGVRSSAGTASYLTAALNQLFGNVTALSLSMGDHMDRLRGSPSGTVVIGVSFLRYARLTFEVMRYARKLSLPTIMITDSLTSPPAQFGDVLFLVSTSSIHYLPSQAAGLSLVNALLGCIALRGRKRVVASLRRFEDSLDESDVFCEGRRPRP
jgi:DNA-binding MurR/RpiR family transcriptional regulator